MRRTRTLTLSLPALALALLAVAAPAGAGGSAAVSGPISNERTVTYWAYAVKAAPVRATPSARSRVVDHLHLSTEDGFTEVYLVLAQKVYPSRTWFQVRLPGRPNGRTGWVPEQALGPLNLSRKHLVVDERRLRLTLYVAGRKVFSAPIGVGAPSTPTPRGNFWVREKFAVTADPFYGPYAFGTADYSTLSDWPHGGVVGIHGTDEPSSVPGHQSHGCVRMHNGDIRRLWPLLSVGTPVTIT